MQYNLSGYSKVVLMAVTIGLCFNQEISAQSKQQKTFKAGASTSVITPKIGTSINGNFQDLISSHVHDDTHARSIVLDDGSTKLAIVVADLCMIGRDILDEAKAIASRATSIPVKNMMVSATHTHSGGTACGVFQSEPDPAYQSFVTERIADAVIRANGNLQPARIGFGAGSEPSQVFNRRWHMKPGSIGPNPFGEKDQVRMNPPGGSPDLIGPAGPIDPEVSILYIQSLQGKPIGLLANYSLHYVGGVKSGSVSADYFGMFCNKMKELLGPGDRDYPFVPIMSNGTSGDINNIDFRGAQWKPSGPYAQMERVANIIAEEVHEVVNEMKFYDWLPLGVEQEEIKLGVRKASPKEIDRAKKLLQGTEGKVLTDRDQIYARESIKLQEYPDQVPLLITAMKIGDLAIASIPCEVFVEIGLEIKEKSPFKKTFTVSLANGYNGYLPTPKHHELGGYETWRARSSYLETQASPKITSTLFGLMNKLHSGTQSQK